MWQWDGRVDWFMPGDFATEDVLHETGHYIHAKMHGYDHMPQWGTDTRIVSPGEAFAREFCRALGVYEDDPPLADRFPDDTAHGAQWGAVMRERARANEGGHPMTNRDAMADAATGTLVIECGVIVLACKATDDATAITLNGRPVGAIRRSPKSGRWCYDQTMREALFMAGMEGHTFATAYEAGQCVRDYMDLGRTRESIMAKPDGAVH